MQQTEESRNAEIMGIGKLQVLSTLLSNEKFFSGCIGITQINKNGNPVCETKELIEHVLSTPSSYNFNSVLFAYISNFSRNLGSFTHYTPSLELILGGA